jgi:hypothetical protein
LAVPKSENTAYANCIDVQTPPQTPPIATGAGGEGNFVARRSNLAQIKLGSKRLATLLIQLNDDDPWHDER